MSKGKQIVDYVRDSLEKTDFEIESGTVIFIGAFNPSLGDLGALRIIAEDVDPEFLKALTTAVGRTYTHSISTGKNDADT